MDLLNNLPEEILCHILSFLTTKEAALTSVLSKRWRNLFAFVPNLHIDDCDFRQSFMEFVDRVLALQGNSPIKKFYLGGMGGIDIDRVSCWIQNVMVRGVSEIVLSIFDDTPSADRNHMFPKVFQNKKLVKLTLSYGFDIRLVDGSIFLPTLKTLILHLVSVSVDTFDILLHALPALEELVLDDIDWKDLDDLDVNVTLSSASLKNLTINYCGSFVTYSFDTPSLAYFCYSSYAAEDYSVAKTENLFEARISVLVHGGDIWRARLPHNIWFEDEEDNVINQFSNVGNLMNGIRNVRCLVLSPDTLEVLSVCCESLPVFNNLKSLTITSNDNRGWQAMPALLRNCPHLETLVLEGLLHHVTDKCGDACDCVSREEKGRSLTSCPVKVLEIKGFHGTTKEIHLYQKKKTKEIHMIKHFLDYFPCLKEIKIYMEEDGPRQLRVPEASEGIAKMMMENYNNMSSGCNVQLLVSGNLYKKWWTP
ncbi:PREDICTED: putative F-box protein At5g38390 [Camelina sativa]|uniref:F-box protein At5g38390 n=1 Tax=Camelina sativa TaxID=90675 RepID=A0ABM1QRU0_CAMSA|nr:PREDICTED: putative F-box protein At5g38390 [Camelina sativa]